MYVLLQVICTFKTSEQKKLFPKKISRDLTDLKKKKLKTQYGVLVGGFGINRF